MKNNSTWEAYFKWVKSYAKIIDDIQEKHDELNSFALQCQNNLQKIESNNNWLYSLSFFLCNLRIRKYDLERLKKMYDSFMQEYQILNKDTNVFLEHEKEIVAEAIQIYETRHSDPNPMRMARVMRKASTIDPKFRDTYMKLAARCYALRWKTGYYLEKLIKKFHV